MHDRDFLKQYQYDLPPDLVASRGVEPRDSARLMVVDTEVAAVEMDIFRDFARHVPPEALIVFNDTKVVPARLTLSKETGGKVEILLLVNEYMLGDTTIAALSNKKLVPGWRLSVDGWYFHVVRQDERFFFLEPEFPIAELTGVLDRYGEVPVPHYLGKSGLPEEELRSRYQSIFATHPRSVAAPTASLHFTDNVFKDLKERNVDHVFVTLHVGLGTFAPLTENQINTGKLHKEFFAITPEVVRKIQKAKEQGRPIIAVGTTVVRTLESATQEILSHGTGEVTGTTDIFIRPGHDFKIVTGMVTNFHLPQTSLMCLVDALLVHKKSSVPIQELYQRAIRERMRFYSFGDAMFIK